MIIRPMDSVSIRIAVVHAFSVAHPALYRRPDNVKFAFIDAVCRLLVQLYQDNIDDMKFSMKIGVCNSTIKSISSIFFSTELSAAR